MVLINKRTGEKVDVKIKGTESCISKTVLLENLSRILNVKPSDLTLTVADGIKEPFDTHDPNLKEKIQFTEKLNFKSFVFLQDATGIWTEKILANLQKKSLTEVVNANPEIKAMITGEEKNISNTWCTLIGLYVLTTFFAEEQKLWRLGADKARKALKQRLNFEADLDTVLTKFKSIELD